MGTLQWADVMETVNAWTAAKYDQFLSYFHTITGVRKYQHVTETFRAGPSVAVDHIVWFRKIEAIL